MDRSVGKRDAKTVCGGEEESPTGRGGSPENPTREVEGGPMIGRLHALQSRAVDSAAFSGLDCGSCWAVPADTARRSGTIMCEIG